MQITAELIDTISRWMWCKFCLVRTDHVCVEGHWVCLECVKRLEAMRKVAQ